MGSEYSVARLAAEALAKAGVARVYGLIGTTILDLVDALYDYRGRVDFVTTRHEQVAVSAADGEARVTGKPGVAALHSGPGLLNSMLSLGIAYRDRVPLVLLVGGVRRRLRGASAWLEVDLEAAASPLAKSYHVVSNASDAPEALESAFREALSPPPGPVVVEVPEDVWRENVRVEDSYWRTLAEASRPPAWEPGDALGFARDAAGLAGQAERPLILACGELAWDPGFRQAALLELAERMGAYVVTSGNGRGACPEDHPRCLGRVGFGGGSIAADEAMESADLLLVLGNEFDDVTTYAYNLLPEGDVLVASLDPAVDSRPRYYERYRASPSAALEHLLRALEGARRARPRWDSAIAGARRKWERVLAEALAKNYGGRANPAAFFKRLDEALPRSRVVTAGQGTHILYTYAFTRIYEPRSFLAATNLGAMSYAFPAALGAKLARRGAPVVSVVGDGDFMMTVQDLETAVRENAPVKVVVVNDNSYKVLYLKQVIQYQGRVYETLLGNPDFSLLAKAFGVDYVKVEKPDDVEAGIRAASEPLGPPALIEVPVNPDDIPPVNIEYTLRMSR